MAIPPFVTLARGVAGHNVRRGGMDLKPHPLARLDWSLSRMDRPFRDEPPQDVRLPTFPGGLRSEPWA